MEQLTIALSSDEAIGKLGQGHGFLYYPSSLSQLLASAEKWGGVNTTVMSTKASYRGLSPFYNLSYDTETILDKKDSLLSVAIALHKGLDNSFNCENPFRLFTEPFPGFTWGRITVSRERQRFVDDNPRELVSLLSEQGIDWIAISQNRLADDTVAELTIDLANRIQLAGIETAISWQCWLGCASFERFELYQRRKKEASEFGVSSFLGEVGIRYSTGMAPALTYPESARAEEQFAEKFILPKLWRRLEAEEQDWTWWPGNPWLIPRPGQIMNVKRICGIDFSEVICENFKCSDEGSSEWGVN